jgi:hypothetical protein
VAYARRGVGRLSTIRFHVEDMRLTHGRHTVGFVSYTVTLLCGCEVYVACASWTGLAHTRIIESQPLGCPIRSHGVGVRLQLCELLASPSDDSPVQDGDHAPSN